MYVCVGAWVRVRVIVCMRVCVCECLCGRVCPRARVYIRSGHVAARVGGERRCFHTRHSPYAAQVDGEVFLLRVEDIEKQQSSPPPPLRPAPAHPRPPHPLCATLSHLTYPTPA